MDVQLCDSYNLTGLKGKRGQEVDPQLAWSQQGQQKMQFWPAHTSAQSELASIVCCQNPYFFRLLTRGTRFTLCRLRVYLRKVTIFPQSQSNRRSVSSLVAAHGKAPFRIVRCNLVVSTRSRIVREFIILVEIWPNRAHDRKLRQ